MRLRFRTRFGVILLALVLVSVGCSKYRKLKKEEEEPLPQPKTMSANPGTGSQPAILAYAPAVDKLVAQNELKAIWTCYMGDGVIPPPGNVEEFKELQQNNPKLYAAVKDGHYVVFWSANRNAGDAVLAYWKHTPEVGGPVLLVNGTTAIMTPAEFKTAPKAGK